jgi:hypothetical protein
MRLITSNVCTVSGFHRVSARLAFASFLRRVISWRNSKQSLVKLYGWTPTCAYHAPSSLGVGR